MNKPCYNDSLCLQEYSKIIGLKRKWHLFGAKSWSDFYFSAESTFQESVSKQNFYWLHGKLTAVWNFTSVNLISINHDFGFTPPEVMWLLIMKLPHTKVKFTPKWNLKPVWVHFGSHVNVLIVRLGTADTKLGSQDAVKKVLELTEKWKYSIFRGKF